MSCSYCESCVVCGSRDCRVEQARRLDFAENIIMDLADQLNERPHEGLLIGQGSPLASQIRMVAARRALAEGDDPK